MSFERMVIRVKYYVVVDVFGFDVVRQEFGYLGYLEKYFKVMVLVYVGDVNNVVGFEFVYVMMNCSEIGGVIFEVIVFFMYDYWGILFFDENVQCVVVFDGQVVSYEFVYNLWQVVVVVGFVGYVFVCQQY